MPQYVLKPSTFQSGQVGGIYHIGLSDGVNSYGYVFQTTGPQGGFKESTNVADKEKLIQFSSPNLIDRDLVFYPRVTQGDFSGGGLQAVFIDPTRYFDSDLEIRTPGYLTLRPGWTRTQLTTGLGAVVPQSVPWNNDVYTTFQGTVYYNSAGSSFSPGISVKLLESDGNVLFISDAANTIKFTTDNSVFVNVTTAATATINQFWVTNQATNGHFVYYSNVSGGSIQSGADTLYKIDLGAVGPGVLVPTGGIRVAIKDIVTYQNGIAIL